MGKHWVKATRTVIRHDIQGAYRTYQPGDWFQCRNQELLELLARNLIDTSAHIIKAEFDERNSGVLCLNGASPPAALESFGIKQKDAKLPELPWKRTLIMEKEACTTIETVALGLMRVATGDDFPSCEMAAMLNNSTQLARDVGSKKDKERTLELIGGLEVPIYDTGLVWVRRTDETKAVVKIWRDELSRGADSQHAFIRAIYGQSVKLCTLPAEWIGKWIRG